MSESINHAMSKPRIIDLDGVRRGDAHLDRAAQLNPRIHQRSVPVATILQKAEPTTTTMQKLTYSVTEAAAVVGFAAETLRRAIRRGTLIAAGGGKGSGYRISGVELERWWRDVKQGGDLFPAVEAEAVA